MIVGALRLLFVMAVWISGFPLVINGLDLARHLVFAALRAEHAGLCPIALGYLCRRLAPVGGRSWILPHP